MPKYSSVIKRVISGFLDGLILFVALVISATVAMLIFVQTTDIGPPPKISITDIGREYYVFFLICFFVWVFVSYLYYIVTEALIGQTLGKMWLKMKVITKEETTIGWEKSIIRNLARVLDAQLFGLVGITIMLISRRNQRIGDLAAGTMVIDIEDETPVPEIATEGAA